MTVEMASSARTGLQRATSTIHGAAHEIANMNTHQGAGLEPTTTRQASDKTQLSGFAHPTKAIIAMKSGELMYRANLAVVKASDEMRGQAADLIA